MARLVFYLPLAFYRTFAAAMLMICLLFVNRREYGWLTALLLVNVLMFSAYMTFFYGIGDYKIIVSDYTTSNSWDSETKNAIEKNIIYDAGATNPWCNTLLIP